MTIPAIVQKIDECHKRWTAPVYGPVGGHTYDPSNFVDVMERRWLAIRAVILAADYINGHEYCCPANHTDPKPCECGYDDLRKALDGLEEGK